MKCELCNKNKAETAITSVRNGVEEELYVCKECANRERVRRQKKSQRTRRGGMSLPPGVSMSVTRIGGGDAPPPLIEAIMNAVTGIVAGAAAGVREPSAKKDEEREYVDTGVKGIDGRCVIVGALHLEGLFLIGEMCAAQRAAKALGMRLEGFCIDGVTESGHVYVLRAPKDAGDAPRRVLEDIAEQERNARARLLGEMRRVMGDAICRALAVLKNCRLLSPGELFDLLSPLRLGAMSGFLDGLSAADVEKMMESVDRSSREDDMDAYERDEADAGRADDANRRFEDVVLSERGEEALLS